MHAPIGNVLEGAARHASDDVAGDETRSGRTEIGEPSEGEDGRARNEATVLTGTDNRRRVRANLAPAGRRAVVDSDDSDPSNIDSDPTRNRNDPLADSLDSRDGLDHARLRLGSRLLIASKGLPISKGVKVQLADREERRLRSLPDRSETRRVDQAERQGRPPIERNNVGQGISSQRPGRGVERSSEVEGEERTDDEARSREGEVSEETDGSEEGSVGPASPLLRRQRPVISGVPDLSLTRANRSLSPRLEGTLRGRGRAREPTDPQPRQPSVAVPAPTSGKQPRHRVQETTFDESACTDSW